MTESAASNTSVRATGWPAATAVAGGQPRELARRVATMALPGTIPPIGYLVAYRAWGLSPAVGVGLVLGGAAVAVERHGAGRARVSWLGLLAIAVGGSLALVTANPKLYFLLLAVLWWAVLGIGLLLSVALGRPLVGSVVRLLGLAETPQRVRGYGIVTTAFGVAYVLRAVVRGYLLARGTLGSYVLTQLATGYPIDAALVAWSLWYLGRTSGSSHPDREAEHRLLSPRAHGDR